MDWLHKHIGKDKEQHTLFVCPQCGKTYTPVLKRKNPNIPIQREFPNAPAWQREQWITHICSDECWNKFVGR